MLCIIFCVLFAIAVLWINTLVEIVNHEYSGHNKIIWLGLVAIMPVIGMILYYAFGRDHILGNTVRSNNWKHSEDEFV